MRRITLIMFIATFFTMGETTLHCMEEPSDNENTISTSESLSRTLGFIHQLAEKDDSINQDSFAQDIENTVRIFEEIKQKFAQGIFEEHEIIRNAFETLCKTIDGIDETVTEAKLLKPWHIRWISDDLDRLMYMVHSIIHKMTSVDDRNFLILLSHFTRNMEDKIFPRCNHIVGTKFDGLVDKCIRRPAEFYKKNWYWTVPTTALVAKVIWDMFNISRGAGDIKLPGIEQVSESSGFFAWLSNKYSRWLLMPIAGIFASLAGKDGVIVNAQTGIPGNKPLQSVFSQEAGFDRNNNPIPCIKLLPKFDPAQRNNPRQRVIRSIPCPQQQDGKSCSLFATYNILCWWGEHYSTPPMAIIPNHPETFRLKDINNDRAKCDRVINYLKYMLKLKRIDDLPVTICREAGINGQNVPQNLIAAHVQWFAQNANRHFIQNNGMQEIFAKWYDDIGATVPDLRRIRRRAVNKICFDYLYRQACRKINCTNRTSREKRELVRTLGTQLNAVIRTRNSIEDRFDNFFPQWQHFRLTNDLTTGNLVPAIPNSLNSFPKRVRFFVKTKLDSMPHNEEIIWLIAHHVPQLSTIDANGDPVLLNNVSVLDRVSARTLTAAPQNGGRNNRIDFWAGIPQFIIFYTGRNPNAEPQNIKFSEDQTIFKNRSSFMVPNHTISMKIEWSDPNRPNQCAPLLTLADSYCSRDLRFSANAHFMTQLFIDGQ